MSTKLDIFNLALNHVGMNKILSDSDISSPSGKACNRYFEPCRDDLFSEHEWPFASVQLELAESSETALLGWDVMYDYPSETISKVWSVFNSAVADRKHEQDFEERYFLDATADTWSSGTTYAVGDYVDYNDVTYISILAGINHIPSSSPTYWSVSQLNKKVILCNLTDAFADASFIVTDILIWDSKFIWALSYKMAAAMAPVLGDADKGIKLMGIANAIISEAKRTTSLGQKKKPTQSSSYQNVR